MLTKEINALQKLIELAGLEVDDTRLKKAINAVRNQERNSSKNSSSFSPQMIIYLDRAFEEDTGKETYIHIYSKFKKGILYISAFGRAHDDKEIVIGYRPATELGDFLNEN